MFVYDNTLNKRRVNSLTVSFDVEGEGLLYTYIRKNACTSFKSLISSYSPHDFRKSGSRLNGMAAHHRVKGPVQARKIRNRIFIYRDPIERVVSVFKNKFIQQSGAKDIIKDFQEVTGHEAETCTFNGFVEEYVMKISEGVFIDAHLLPQQWHLLPIVYNRVIPLSLVEKGMADIVGDEISSRFFSKPSNSTRHSSCLSAAYCADVSIGELRRVYRTKGFFPSHGSLLTSRIIELLRDLYKDDYEMLVNIHFPE